MKLRWFAFLIVLLAGCSSKHDYQNPPWNPEVPVKRAMQWMPISEQAGKAWGVSPRLVTAIIAVESGGNPTLVSKSNAVGLMQLKASTAGREVYRYMGWSGQPSTSERPLPQPSSCPYSSRPTAAMAIGRVISRRRRLYSHP